MITMLAVIAASTGLLAAPIVHDPTAEQAFLQEFHQAMPYVPVAGWGDKQSLELGYTICRAAGDGIDLDHYRSSPWQGRAVDPALRYLCPDAAPA